MVGPIGWLRGDDLKAEARISELQGKVTQLEKKAINADAVRAELLGEQADAAENVTTIDAALQCATVLACARVIAEGLAQVPCRLIKPSKNGGKEDATDHPLYNVLRRKPNEHQTSFEFREQIGIQLSLAFEAFAFVVRGTDGRVLELLPYAPKQVEVVRNGLVNRYFVKINGKKQEIPSQNMWHIKGPSLDGFRGLDAIRLAREAIGLSLATTKFGSNLFRNGARPSGLLSTDQTLTGEQLQALRQSWDLSHQGASNSLKTAVLANGMKYAPLSATPDEAQFIETRKLQVEEICRIYRVLPIMVMHTDVKVSYNSIEQLMLAHLTHTLAPWYERIEQSAENMLLSEAELAAGYSIKFDTRGLLKGAAQERAIYYQTMRSSGLMTINECRDLEDLDRINDPIADKLQPAANLFGQQPADKPATANPDSTGDNAK